MLSSDKKIEYIASGTSYMRLHSPRNAGDPVNGPFISELLSKIAKSSPNHEFGLLFNGFTEQSFGPRFRKLDGYHSIHADSGGLQIITQGKAVTDEIKDDIYRNQCASADFGMCFDEIPIGTQGKTSGRNDVTNRWFKPDEMEHYAKLTGKNIARQIHVYREQKSECKPILIAQGNCYDTYMKWVDIVLEQIPYEDKGEVTAVAMGAAALGTGTLEDIERAFIFSQLQMEKKHLHVLGVGSAKRMLPYLIFKQSGLYDESLTMSYDSTTHTSGVELGLYYTKNRKQVAFDRKMSKFYEATFEDISTICDMAGLDAHKFHKIMNTGYTKYIDQGGEDFDFLRARTAFTVKSIMNYIEHVDWMMESRENMLQLAIDAEFYNPAKALYNVKSKGDFDIWLGHFSRRVKSKRVQSGKPTDLEDFF